MTTNTTNLLTLIETNRDTIISALVNADKCAYEYPACEYAVEIYADGTTKIREDLAGSDAWKTDDEAVAIIGPFNHEHLDLISYAYDDKDTLISDLRELADETEKRKLETHLCGLEDGYNPTLGELIDFVRKNMWDTSCKLESDIIENIQWETDYDAILDEWVEKHC